MAVLIVERFSRAGPRGRGREWATQGVHPLSWLLSNNRLEKVPFVSVLHTSSNRLLLSNQDKGCTPCVAHSLPLPLGPALLNLWTNSPLKKLTKVFLACKAGRAFFTLQLLDFAASCSQISTRLFSGLETLGRLHNNWNSGTCSRKTKTKMKLKVIIRS